MSYQEARYWEKRYRAGASSGDGLPAERRFLAEAVGRLARTHQFDSVLDVGVGDGQLARMLVSEIPDAVDYTGVDISAAGVRLARRNVPASVRLEVADIVVKPLPARDLVLCFNVHYHMATAERATRLVENVLASATKVALVLTWNSAVLRRGPLAAHCHYRPLHVSPGSGFELDADHLPGSPHKSLYTLVRTRDPR